jgi:RNA polymerase sigma-70 factor, ECF subfamily
MADQNSADQDWSVRMRSALAGNELAYRDLLAELSRRLRPIVRRGFGGISAGANEIEDVVQDVLLAIHLKRHTWDQSKPIGPWIMAITRNKIIDNLRRRGRRGEVAIDGDIEQFAANETGDAMAGHDVARILGRLNGRNREIVQAISIDGHTTREVAERLGMTEVAVRVTLHRSLKTLAAEFQETKP